MIRFAALLSLLLLAVGAQALDLHRTPRDGTALLAADEAFQLLPATRSADGIQIGWVIAPGYYLYRQRFAIEPVGAAAPLPSLRLPAGQPKHDEHFGDVEIYTGAVTATVPLPKGRPLPAQLKVRWQGCAEAGVCYPPVSRVIDVPPAP